MITVGGRPLTSGNATPGTNIDFAEVLRRQAEGVAGRVNQISNSPRNTSVKPPVGNRPVRTPGSASQKIH